MVKKENKKLTEISEIEKELFPEQYFNKCKKEDYINKTVQLKTKYKRADGTYPGEYYKELNKLKAEYVEGLANKIKENIIN